jgi:hypothetical protein
MRIAEENHDISKISGMDACLLLARNDVDLPFVLTQEFAGYFPAAARHLAPVECRP